MTKIEELEQKLNECQKELAELKESKKEGKWKPESGECYWFRDDNGNNYVCTYDNKNIYDNWRINNLPIFSTKEECERYWRFMDTVKEKSYIFSNKEWNRYNLTKWYIRKIDKRICVDCIFSGNCYGSIYFKTKEDAQYIIDNYKEELLKYWL